MDGRDHQAWMTNMFNFKALYYRTDILFTNGKL